MKQNIKLKSMTAAIVVALTLNACNMGVVANKQAPHSQERIVSNITLINEHHIEKPSDEKKKEEYDKIKDKIVVDNDVKKPAKEEKKDTIHQLLANAPTKLNQQFNELDGQIKLISDNWQASLDKNGVKISSETKVINKFGKPVHISDAIVYFDPDSQARTIYVNSNINYENNADTRRELEYGLIRGLIKSNKNIVFDEDFVNAVKTYTQVEEIELYNYPELERISQFSAEDLKLAENQDKMATLFASVMADSFEYKTYAEIWREMAEYLDKFEHDKLADLWCTKQQIKMIQDIEINFAKIVEGKTQLSFYEEIGGVITGKGVSEEIFKIRYQNLPNLDDNSRKVLFDNFALLEKIGYSDAYQLLADPVLITKPQLFAGLVEYAKKSGVLKESIWKLREQYRETLPIHTYYRGMALSKGVKDQFVANKYLTPRLYGEINNIALRKDPENNSIEILKDDNRTDLFVNQYTVLADKNADENADKNADKNKSYLVPRVDLYGNLKALLSLHISPALNSTKSAASLYGEQPTGKEKVHASEIKRFRDLFGGDYLKTNLKTEKYTILDRAVMHKVNNSFSTKISQFSALSSITPYKEVAASAALIAQKDSEQNLYIFKLEMTDLDFLSYSDIFPLEYPKDLTTTQKELLDRLRTLDNDALENELSSWDKNDSSFNKKSEVWELAVSERFQRNVEQFVYGTIKISGVDSITQDDYNADLIKDYTKNNTKIKQLLVKDGLLKV